MHKQDAANFDAHLPSLQVACVPESYDDEKDPCLWKRQEAWDPHPFAEDQEHLLIDLVLHLKCT